MSIWLAIHRAPALTAATPTNNAKQHDCMQAHELVGGTLGSPSGVVHIHQLHKPFYQGQTHIQRHLEASSGLEACARSFVMPLSCLDAVLVHCAFIKLNPISGNLKFLVLQIPELGSRTAQT